ncbi:MAG: hypothetical protein K2P84_04545, partial [Undibacterium sp.]|nr:hypothetical protein [Undibacterium sp.]
MITSVNSDALGRVLLPIASFPEQCAREKSRQSWLIATLGDDRTVLKINAHASGRNNDLVAHTMIDRKLFRAGDTVSMQHLLRQNVRQGWTLPSFVENDKAEQIHLRILRGGREVVYQEKLQWKPDGSAVSSWKIPIDAKLGHYQYQLSIHEEQARSEYRESVLHRGAFQIEEFRLPVFEAQLSLNTTWAEHQQTSSVLGELNARISYLGGGSAANQLVKVKGEFQYSTDYYNGEYRFVDEPWPRPKATPLPEMRLRLNSQGRVSEKITLPKVNYPITLHADMEFDDPNGETQTQTLTTVIWPQMVRIGLQLEPSIKENQLEINAILLDEKNKGIKNKNIIIESHLETGDRTGDGKDAVWHTVCTITSNAVGKARCEMALPNTSFKWKIRARAEHAQELILKVFPEQFRWKHTAEIIEVLDEQSAVKVGDKTKLRVRSPFLPAQLLLSVEREGTFESQLISITQEEQEVVLPIAAHYVPAVHIYAQLVRGALQGGVADRQGQLELRLDPTSHRLAVEIKPSHQLASPGQTLGLQLTVRRAEDGVLVPDAQLTISVVDEALLNLAPNSTWNVLEYFWRARYLGIQTYANQASNLQLPLKYIPPMEYSLLNNYCYIGRACIHSIDFSNTNNGTRYPDGSLQFAPNVVVSGARGKVDVSHSPTATRKNFTSLAAWVTNLKSDANGEAKLNFILPDSLTTWRIVAIATHASDQFGTAENTVTVNKPLQLVSGLPQTVRAGDVLRQKITLRNTGDQPLKIRLTVSNNLAVEKPLRPLQQLQQLQQTYTLSAGENRDISWLTQVPQMSKDPLDPHSITWKISAQAVGVARVGEVSLNDVIEVKQKIVELH